MSIIIKQSEFTSRQVFALCPFRPASWTCSQFCIRRTSARSTMQTSIEERKSNSRFLWGRSTTISGRPQSLYHDNMAVCPHPKRARNDQKWMNMNEQGTWNMEYKLWLENSLRTSWLEFRDSRLQPLPFSSSDLPQSKRRAFGWNWHETREKRGPKNLQKRKAVKQTSLDGSNEAFSLLHG